MSRTEQPVYKVEHADGAIELRAYPALDVATVTLHGSRRSAIKNGFRTLAGYIFGGNEGAKKIEMTAPVMESRSVGDGGALGVEHDWTIWFIMPQSWPKDSLPKPNNARVSLDTAPAGRFAVIRFSGFWRDALLQDKVDELRAAMGRHHWSPVGSPIYAFYNPPWTLPMFRRNEVMIAVGPE